VLTLALLGHRCGGLKSWRELRCTYPVNPRSIDQSCPASWVPGDSRCRTSSPRERGRSMRRACARWSGNLIRSRKARSASAGGGASASRLSCTGGSGWIAPWKGERASSKSPWTPGAVEKPCPFGKPAIIAQFRHVPWADPLPAPSIAIVGVGSLVSGLLMRRRLRRCRDAGQHRQALLPSSSTASTDRGWP
jgi:hypothetical protein